MLLDNINTETMAKRNRFDVVKEEMCTELNIEGSELVNMGLYWPPGRTLDTSAINKNTSK